NLLKANSTKVKPDHLKTQRPAHPLRPRPVMPVSQRAALQTPEATKYVGLSKGTLRSLERKGVLHPNRVTGKLLWLVSELDAFLASPVRGSKVYEGYKG